MTTKKHPYTAPEADLLVIRFEENLLLSGGEAGDPGMPGGDFVLDDNIFDFPGIL